MYCGGIARSHDLRVLCFSARLTLIIIIKDEDHQS
jgi:hypothetical protein